jgi:hypothetical protein
MDKHNSVSVGLVDSVEKTITVVDSIRGGQKTKLWAVIALISGYVCRQHRHKTAVSYIRSESAEDESRREFQRFLYW